MHSVDCTIIVLCGGKINLKIGVLSDSHVYDLKDLSKKAIIMLEDMDLIVHAGDFTGKRLVDELRKLGNFNGVYGNMDPFSIRKELPEKMTLELEGFKVGVTHPSEGGPPFGLNERIKKKFEYVDAIIYGHTHLPRNEVINGILYFNPGSITGKFPARHRTFGILEIGKELKGKIVSL
jgi:putative phosphoesterase